MDQSVTLGHSFLKLSRYLPVKVKNKVNLILLILKTFAISKGVTKIEISRVSFAFHMIVVTIAN